MRKLISFLAAGVAISAVIVSLLIQHQAGARLRQTGDALRQQEQQIAEAEAEQSRLNRLILDATNLAVASGTAAELESLRREAEALRQRTNELAALPKTKSRRAPPRPESHSEEYFAESHRLAGERPKDALILGMALVEYASDHDGRLPANFADADSYMRERGERMTGTNQFDVVYHRSLNDLTNVPRGQIALLRSRDTWIAPSGKPARVYGMADGASQIVESDDNFESWEAGHVVPPGNP